MLGRRLLGPRLDWFTDTGELENDINLLEIQVVISDQEHHRCVRHKSPDGRTLRGQFGSKESKDISVMYFLCLRCDKNK